MAASTVRSQYPLVVIVGPTASGKTALAIELAERYGGEIICADSRTVYRGMDIGTAKPTSEEQSRVPHWGLDLVDPGERFTAADFKRYTLQKIDEIRGRGHVPFLVGGTGLYVAGVVYDYQFGAQADLVYRSQLEEMSLARLQEYCIKNNINLPHNAMNKRQVIRAIEQDGVNIRRNKLPAHDSIVVGISTNTNQLRTRIVERAEQLFKNGVVEEAIKLGEKYGWKSEAMTGNIYPLAYLYLSDQATLNEIQDIFTTRDWQLAKRQLTWFRRDPYIIWGSPEELRRYLTLRLAQR